MSSGVMHLDSLLPTYPGVPWNCPYAFASSCRKRRSGPREDVMNKSEREEQARREPHSDGGGSSSGYACEPPLGSTQEDWGDIEPGKDD